MRSSGGGELALAACPGVGNRPPNENKIANPRGYARGGMATGRIEPCINNVTDGLCFAVVPYLSEINRAKSFAPLSVPHVWDSGTHNKQ